MNCENIKEKLSLYIDNLLDPDEKEKIREHIESCDSCRIYYDKLLKLDLMANGFVTTDNAEYWESQKDKVMEQIGQAESEKIIDVQPIRKQNRFYKYLAVAASLALVGIVSIYESEDFNQVKGLFDDSDEIATEQLMDTDDADELEVKGGRAGETSVIFNAPSQPDKKPEELKEVEKENIIEVKAPQIPAESAPTASKKRTEKSQATSPKIIETAPRSNITLDGIEPESITPKPVSLESFKEPVLELGEAGEHSNNGELLSAYESIERTSQDIEVKPLSINLPEPEINKDKTELSYEEMQKKGVGNLGKRNLVDEESAMTFESDEGKDYMPEPPMEPAPAEDTSDTIDNLYRAKLDSLEKKYRGIYSPHYMESTSKSRKGIHPDSLDTVILELAEACFQVGILSLDEKEREDMIEKLRRLSIKGSPETIEKIQRYIVLLLAAE